MQYGKVFTGGKAIFQKGVSNINGGRVEISALYGCILLVTIFPWGYFALFCLQQNLDFCDNIWKLVAESSIPLKLGPWTNNQSNNEQIASGSHWKKIILCITLTLSAITCMEEIKVNLKAHLWKLSVYKSKNHSKIKRKYRKQGNARFYQVKNIKTISKIVLLS